MLGKLTSLLISRRTADTSSMLVMDEAVSVGDQQLGRLAPVDPRSIWPHEALNFTPWLAQNADRLAEALGIGLEFEATEHPVGGYALDIIGKDQTNDVVLIVENQLGDSDHSHLGQLVTYAAGTGASTIVWITTRFRASDLSAWAEPPGCEGGGAVPCWVAGPETGCDVVGAQRSAAV